VKTLAIEINDAELVIADQNGVKAKEPGYAALVNGSVVTGLGAYSQARLNPRQTNNRYWEDLSMESGSAGIDSVGSSAELAYNQLDSIWKRFGQSDMDALLVAPAHYTHDQLGLLLGMSQECNMPVRAMANAGVAASTRPYPNHQILHLDASLHRVSASVIEQNDDAFEKHEQGLDSVGLSSLFDLWAARVAEIFVLQTRFDPFHHAETEQLVYDFLPVWLAELQEQGESELKISHNGEEYCVNIQREHLLGVADGFCKALIQLSSQLRKPETGLVVQLSHRLHQLPGITSEFEKIDNTHVVSMNVGEAALGMLKGLKNINHTNNQVKLLKRLSWRDDAVELDTPQSEKSVTSSNSDNVIKPLQPTHLVYRGIAYAINSDAIYISQADDENFYSIVVGEDPATVSQPYCEIIRKEGVLRLIDLNRSNAYVNNKKISSQIDLHTADVIRIGSSGEELHVIAVGGNIGS